MRSICWASLPLPSSLTAAFLPCPHMGENRETEKREHQSQSRLWSQGINFINLLINNVKSKQSNLSKVIHILTKLRWEPGTTNVKFCFFENTMCSSPYLLINHIYFMHKVTYLSFTGCTYYCLILCWYHILLYIYYLAKIACHSTVSITMSFTWNTVNVPHCFHVWYCFCGTMICYIICVLYCLWLRNNIYQTISCDPNCF